MIQTVQEPTVYILLISLLILEIGTSAENHTFHGPQLSIIHNSAIVSAEYQIGKYTFDPHNSGNGTRMITISWWLCQYFLCNFW